ncbi:hypothetical protein BC938DRAFT_480392 [Jimgerdemannia flammicorona]|uniref:Kinesin-like protein n=1 Tax=Jimgerdemannia flammicorona TaxID=994334 RepID=A0A433QIN4_9FUNG|nr:hypothetical protein BC938DRAFT_480392 [Jimgerdemannia flammicorona]
MSRLKQPSKVPPHHNPLTTTNENIAPRRAPSPPAETQRHTLKRKADAREISKPTRSRVTATAGPPAKRPALASSSSTTLGRAKPVAPTRKSSRLSGEGSRPPSVASAQDNTRPSKGQPQQQQQGQQPQPENPSFSAGMPKRKKRAAWDTKGRLEDMEEAYAFLQNKAKSSDETVTTMRQMMEMEKKKIEELETFRSKLETKVETKETETREAQRQISDLQHQFAIVKINHADEIGAIRSQHARETQELEMAKESLQREGQALKRELEDTQQQLQGQKTENAQLRTTISQQSVDFLSLESDNRGLKLKLERTEETLASRERTIAELEEKLGDSTRLVAELEAKIREEEMVRRKLHNTIQELKGNIRVFCRIRPPLDSERDVEGGVANMEFPGQEGKEIELSGISETAQGSSVIKAYPFSFDRVFQPGSSQQTIFEEISQLVQSALDGYNTYTMEGPSNEDEVSVGMIPRAVRQIYSVAESLKEKGWTYQMEGQFLEIYNEAINDLLGNGDFDKKKHEIKHEKNGRTIVTDLTTVILDTPAKVTALLKKASQNRAVGATNMNERSSRSHSVFTLRLTGHNAVTDEQSTGVLNLIDLAGSERLSSSGSTGDRLKETQAINKSLSCLGDVIYALANNKDGHVPYRNSKLTYLLQNSLGGNSKTLMFVNISPLNVHFSETICSLRFATKVNSCQIGTAKKIVTSSKSITAEGHRESLGQLHGPGKRGVEH